MARMEIEYLAPEEISPYKDNAKEHDDKQIRNVAKSIEKYGWQQPIVLDKDNVIIVGHGRFYAALRLGLEEVPCIRATDLTPEEVNEYRLLDNKLNESEWNKDLLEKCLKGLDMSEFDIDWDLPELIEPEEEAEEDGYEPNPPAEPNTKRGQVWKLGRHRLMCGSSTETQDMEKLMNGQEADLLLTDPPYGVDYEGGTGLKIENDDMQGEEFIRFLTDAFETADQVMKPGAAFYIWHADGKGYEFTTAAHNAGWRIRQVIIWVKNALVLGRQDYQWKHEPCQPAGTMVWTPDGPKAIETLKDGDRVISFDTYSGSVKGYRDGLEIKTANRHYNGIMYTVWSDGRETKATDNHQFSVRFNELTSNNWCTYLMRKDNWWRVGVTRMYDARGFGLKHRVDQEHADEAWIIDTFKNQADAQMGEQLLACKYGIPYTYWEARNIDNGYNSRTSAQIEWLYKNLDLDIMQERAEALLKDYGRNIRFPLVTKANKRAAFSRRVTARIEACNLIPELMMLPIPKVHYDGDATFEWKQIDGIKREDFDGEVYSLAVDKYEHYIADGIVTHNCLYGWKEGAGHYFTPSRQETTTIEEEELDLESMKKEELKGLLERILDQPATVIYENKPKRNDVHPTMKPVRLMGKLIQNSTRQGQIVLDSFGGSGSTMIAAEQLGRTCYMMELDPAYCDVIIDRYYEFTGIEPELLEG